MIPFLFSLFPSQVFPESAAVALAGLVGGPMKPMASVYYSFVLTMLPVGLKISHKLLLAKDELPTDAVKKNIAPRQAARKLSATNPFYARLEDIESHMYEAGGFMGVGIAVLCALQAGVAKGSVSLYSTSYLSAKALWMLFYFLSQEMFVRSEIAGVLGVLRTFSFLGSLASVAQLLAAAATQ
jgi:uncharacterized MAPEG superfamily protein